MKRPTSGFDPLLESMSERLRSVWAKSGGTTSGTVDMWAPLVAHAMDTAGMMEHLWNNWLAPSQKALLTAPFEELEYPLVSTEDSESLIASPEEAARTYLTLVAALHDVGKVSKPFANKVPVLGNRMSQFGLDMPERGTPYARDIRIYRHALAGQMIVIQTLRTRANMSIVAGLATVVGSHHGTTPTETEIKDARESRHRWSDEDGMWTETQTEFVEFCVKYTNAAPLLQQKIKISQAHAVLTSGLLIVADWIASSQDLFPLTSLDDTRFGYLEAQGGQFTREEYAWKKLALPQPEPFPLTDEDTETMLQSRFDLDENAVPRPVQSGAVEAARQTDGPALIFIEDAMGAGKTEAGLLCAEVLGARNGLAGFLVALPTQATTDAMFARVMKYLSCLHYHRESDTYTAALLHGKSRWNPLNSQLRRSGQAFLENAALSVDIPIGNFQSWEDADSPGEAHDIIAHSWFSGKKKSVLAQFVTSTIDHLLLGALRQKHLMLRHLGFTQKVVIIDEAHASSEFMNVFALQMLQWLGAYRVPVVILSATLHQDLRERLATAYLRGMGKLKPRESAELPTSDTYPRITVVTADKKEILPVAPATTETPVTMRAHPVDDCASELVLDLAKQHSWCILVIKNTVAGAQELYEQVRQQLGDNVGLFHSRFTVSDRLTKDQWLRDHFGPPNKSERPDFFVAITTQVAEQSLDIDFDTLVTDLAPTDLLLQRIGRMHRHTRNRPRQFSEPVCHVLGVPQFGCAPKLDRGSAAVYGEYPLLRSALVLGDSAWSPEGTQWVLPSQIGELVEGSQSGEYSIPHPWEEEYLEARHQFQQNRDALLDKANTFLLQAPKAPRASALPLTGWLQNTGNPDASDCSVRPKVREGDESVEVILIERRGNDYYTVDGSTADVMLVDPHSTPTPEQAIAIAKGSVRLPQFLTGYSASATDATLDALESSDFRPFAWDAHYLLAGQLYLVIENGETTLGKHRIRYTRERGLEKI